MSCRVLCRHIGGSVFAERQGATKRHTKILTKYFFTLQVLTSTTPTENGDRNSKRQNNKKWCPAVIVDYVIRHVVFDVFAYHAMRHASKFCLGLTWRPRHSSNGMEELSWSQKSIASYVCFHPFLDEIHTHCKIRHSLLSWLSALDDLLLFG